jgi:hypothetical protein
MIDFPSVWVCQQCRMKFSVVDEHRKEGEILRCPENSCGLRFRNTCPTVSTKKKNSFVSVKAQDLDSHQRRRQA